ncbi:MAG: protein kinase [Pseudomonadota bacterium]
MAGTSPQKLGTKYTLLELIGMGGMAEVFKGKLSGAEGFEKIVVIKKLFPQFAQDREIVSHFIAEAKLAALLQHENIAQIYDFGELDGNFFIAMEYLIGKDLHTVIQRAKELQLPLGTAQALFITAKILEGMEYAHSLKDHHQQPLNLIHRDLSPHNVFITFEGRVKIIDFGIARADLFDNKTKVGMAKGKISYMSPEQLTAEKVDQRSDIFAIGILLYEMLSGQRMYSGDTATVIRKCLGGEYERLDAVRPDLPTALHTILDKALAKDVEGRYQRCGLMLTDIEEFLFSIEKRPSGHLLDAYMHRLFSDEPTSESKNPLAEEARGHEEIHGNSREPVEATVLLQTGSHIPPPPPGVSDGTETIKEAAHVPPAQDISLADKAEEPLTKEPRPNRPRVRQLLVTAVVCTLVAVVFFMWSQFRTEGVKNLPPPAPLPAENTTQITEEPPQSQSLPSPLPAEQPPPITTPVISQQVPTEQTPPTATQATAQPPTEQIPLTATQAATQVPTEQTPPTATQATAQIPTEQTSPSTTQVTQPPTEQTPPTATPVISQSPTAQLEQPLDKISGLLEQAVVILTKQQPTVSDLETALNIYHQVQETQPDNWEAQTGIDRISEYQRNITERAMMGGNFPQSQQNAQKRLFNEPQDTRFLSLQGLVGGKRQRIIQSLIGKAEQAMERNDLTAPEGNNAYRFYREIIELEPQNGAALLGFVKISEKYADMAEDAFREMRLTRARACVRQGLVVNPQNKRLVELQQALLKTSLR